MTDKPIIFSAPMIRALLGGRKSQTRRVLKPQPFPVGGPFYRPHPVTDPRQWHSVSARGFIVNIQTLPYAPGDRLWVREACHIDGDQTTYRADMPAGCDTRGWGWKTSIFMPRWASRLTLTVTDVRVQRVREISEADAAAEGADYRTERGKAEIPGLTAKAQFEVIWDDINGERGFGWDANPWVVALTFDVHRCNIDDMGAC